MILNNPTFLGQFVDTMHTSHKCINQDFFTKDFQELILYLQEKKELAQEQKIFGTKSLIIDDFLGLGKFEISSKGIGGASGGYAYVLSNGQVSIHISNADYDGNKPQMKIEYRSHFLYDVGYMKAYEYGKQIVKRVLLEATHLLSRIDLATDVMGIDYKAFDVYRFQTLYQKSDFKEFHHHYKLTGMQFGRGDFMFRIYDKTKEIQKNLNKSYFKEFWALNGYREGMKVWRQEVQYRRADLKLFYSQSIWGKVDDEPEYIFSKIKDLWVNALQKVRFTDLTNDEVFKISDIDNSNSIKSIFQRRRKTINKNSEFNFWQFLESWQNQHLDICENVREKHFSIPSTEYAERALKSFISQSFKLDNNPQKMVDIANIVEEKLALEGFDIHTYGLLSSFTSSLEIYKAVNSGKLANFDYDFTKSHYPESVFIDNYAQLLSRLAPQSELSEDVENKFNKFTEMGKLKEFVKKIEFDLSLRKMGYRQSKIKVDYLETEYVEAIPI